MTSFSTTNSVFYITNENKTNLITTPGHWNFELVEKTNDEINEVLELRSQNLIELHVEQVRKTGLILLNYYSLPSLSTFKKEKLEELKKSKYNFLEDMVYRFQLTYDEILDILELK